MRSTTKFKFILTLLALSAKHPIEARWRNKGASLLHGTHLVIGGVSSVSGIIINRNASGHVISAQGIPVSMLEWLAAENNFTFSYLATNVATVDGSPGQKGLLDYIRSGLIDIALPVVPTSRRTATLDYTLPYLYIPVSYLIPFGESYANVSAVTGPFSFWVWFGIVLAIIVATATFFLINSIYESVFKADQLMRAIPEYVLGVFLSQGGSCTASKHSIRIVATCWCLASTVFVYSYSSVLIAYLTLPNPDLLINSIEDLKDRPDVQLVTDKGISTDAMLISSETGILKVLGDKLRQYPKSRCNVTRDCVDLVKSGSHVYSGGLDTYLTRAMRDDYTRTNQCNLRLGKSYTNLELSWGTAKFSPIIRELNIGIMRMREMGLVTTWKKTYETDASKCIAKAKERPLYPRLSLHQLTGAFVILLIGYVLSSVAFGCETRN